MVKKLTFVDLFAGAGGLSNGLEQAGLKCILGVDFDKPAMETFRNNHRSAEIYDEDIKNLTEKEIIRLTDGQKADLVCGGPPCQGLSTVGKGIPDDPRNYLFKHFVRLVEVLNPNYIVFENVTGLVGKKNEKILEGILEEFEKIGFHLGVRVLSAQQYGVPQKRRRTIFIGNNKGYKNIYPIPTHDGNDLKLPPARTVADAFENLAAPDGRIYNHDKKAAEIKKTIDKERIRHVPEGKGIRYKNDEEKYLPNNLKFGIDWATVDEKRFRQTKYQRLHRNEPAPTVMTDRNTYFHPTEDRYLTVREAAALQSFPNDFVFFGTISQQWRQIGNAVPTLLAKEIGESILKMHSKKEKAPGRKLTISKVRSRAFNYKSKEIDKAQQKLITA